MTGKSTPEVLSRDTVLHDYGISSDENGLQKIVSLCFGCLQSIAQVYQLCLGLQLVSVCIRSSTSNAIFYKLGVVENEVDSISVLSRLIQQVARETGDLSNDQHPKIHSTHISTALLHCAPDPARRNFFLPRNNTTRCSI